MTVSRFYVVDGVETKLQLLRLEIKARESRGMCWMCMSTSHSYR